MGEIARWWKENRAPSPPQRNFRDVPGASDTYIALVPHGGIAGLTDLGTSSSSSEAEQPQYADCAIWRIANDGSFTPIPGLRKRVYNLSCAKILGSTWIPVTKDKFGNWYNLGSEAILLTGVTSGATATGATGMVNVQGYGSFSVYNQWSSAIADAKIVTFGFIANKNRYEFIAVDC